MLSGPIPRPFADVGLRPYNAMSELGSDMRRRDFIKLIGVSAAAWPLSAQAQQSSKLAKVGYLGPSSLALEHVQVDAFKQRLQELGHVEGKDITYLFHWAEGQDERFPALAAELVGLKPDVIVTTGTPGTLAAKRATNTIPIVFASSANPVTAGLVATYSRPGGNVTGFTILGPELEGKRVQLLKEAIPTLSRVAVMWNPANPGIVDFLHQMRAAAAALNVMVKPIAEVTQISELKNAFTAIADSQPQAMLVIADRFLLAHRAEIVSFAAAQRLPTMYPYRGYVDAGGFMAYAPIDVEQFRLAAGAVSKILRGAKPVDIPVEEPTRYEFVINLRTARALGIEVSPFLQQRADLLID
jgi:putative tryptophan/tyrosine transport system substrate-binding protein